MIFVTIGTAPQGFDRLIKGMDEISANIDEKVIMQIGGSKFIPLNAEYFRITSRENIKKYYREARIIVSHAAAGTILMANSFDKSPILVPRMSKYGEHVDDHQVEGANEWEKEGMTVVYDIDNLKEVLINRDASDNVINRKKEKKLITNLKTYLRKIDHE